MHPGGASFAPPRGQGAMPLRVRQSQSSRTRPLPPAAMGAVRRRPCEIGVCKGQMPECSERVRIIPRHTVAVAAIWTCAVGPSRTLYLSASVVGTAATDRDTPTMAARPRHACIVHVSHELIPDWMAAPRIFSARGADGGGPLAQEPLILTPYC